MKQRAFLVATILALAVAGVYTWQATDHPLDKAGTVRLAASLSLPSAPFWIAQARGLFARAGLGATVEAYASGKVCTEALQKGEAELASAAEFLVARVAFTDKSLRILGTTAFVHTTKLLGLKDRGVAGPADLGGKRVGVNLGTNSEYFLARLLTLNGMKRDDIAWVNVKVDEMADALAAGEVDAVIVWSPYTRQIKLRLGERVSESDGQPGQDYYYVALGRQDWLVQNPKIAERVMLALTWAVEWMTAHPDETRDFLAAKYGVPAEELDEDLQNTRFDIGLPQTLLTAMEAESRWLVEQGSQGAPPANSLDLIAFGPLAAIAPAAVTMVRGTSGP